MSYAEIEFSNLNENKVEILIALLNEAGYSGFEYGEKYLKAYITAADLDKLFLEVLCNQQEVSYTCTIIEDINWNNEWEKNFAPVIINDKVCIRAAFHAKPNHVKYDIVITPKMSFGTGHHETTSLMIEQMLKLDFIDKTVLDFGTGTGVLAILAEKLGALKIAAVDNDINCIENATENAEVNGCKKIIISNKFEEDLEYDFIMANINKNTILEYLPVLRKKLKKDGTIVLSGFLNQDEEVMKSEGDNNVISYQNTASKNEWLCMRFTANKQLSL